MKILICACIITVLLVQPAFADNLFLEAGLGLFKSAQSEIILARYDHDTSRLFNHPSYWEGVAAYWNNSTQAEALAFARGIRWSIRDDREFQTTLGLAGINHVTDHLGTRLQFFFRFAYDMKFEKTDFQLALIHISNGKLLFNWHGPNTGENFVTFSLGLF